MSLSVGDRTLPLPAPSTRGSPSSACCSSASCCVALLLGFWGLVIALRLVQIQVLEHRAYEVRAARQSERTINLAPRRGAILDRNGRQLAVSVDAESIHADPQSIGDADGDGQGPGAARYELSAERAA